jgi:hypothetical protein
MITAPIKGDITFEDAEGFEDLPAFPDYVPYPTVHWASNDPDLELLVTLTMDDRTGTYRFLGNGSGGILPNPETGDTETARILWQRLNHDTARAINAWANAAHARLEHAIAKLLHTTAPEGSEAYAAIIAFATADDVNPGYAKTAKERSLERAQDALKPYVTFADDELERPGRYRDLLMDLMHAADEQGVDFDAALERARHYYQEDLAAPGFDTDHL